MAPETLGSYQIVRQLRAEPLGRVVVCRDPDTGGSFLGKELFVPRHLTEAARQELVFNFRLALRALEEADPPPLVPLVEWGEQEGQHYALFELPHGETLEELMEERGPLDSNRALTALTAALEVLQVLSDNGVAPTEVDPRNLFLAADGTARWAELGFAHYLREEADATTRDPGEDKSLKSPEVRRGDPATAASLVYSLGALLFRLLSGERVGHAAAGGGGATAQIGSPAEHLARLPTGLREVLGRALRVQPEERYREVGEMRQALAALGPAESADGGVPSLRPQPPADRQRPVSVVFRLAAVAAAVALMVVAAMLLQRAAFPPSRALPATVLTPAAADAQRPDEEAPPTPLVPPVSATQPAAGRPAQSATRLPVIRYQTPPAPTTTTLPVARPRNRATSARAGTRKPEKAGTARPQGSRSARARPATPPVPRRAPAPRTRPAAQQPQAKPTADAQSVAKPPQRDAPPTGLPPGVKRRF